MTRLRRDIFVEEVPPTSNIRPQIFSLKIPVHPREIRVVEFTGIAPCLSNRLPGIIYIDLYQLVSVGKITWAELFYIEMINLEKLFFFSFFFNFTG